jgi:hypothetical protein
MSFRSDLPLVDYKFTVEFWDAPTIERCVPAFNFISAITELLCRIEAPLDTITNIKHDFVRIKDDGD